MLVCCMWPEVHRLDIHGLSVCGRKQSRLILSYCSVLCLKGLWKTMDKVSGCSWLPGQEFKSAVLELSQCIWQCSQHFVYDITMSDMHCSIFSEKEITGGTGELEENNL